MADPRNARWQVLNRYLALTIGNHRIPGWSLGNAREAAFSGVWDDLATSALAPAPVRVVTDSNVNAACVYEVGDDRSVYISTVLPVFTAWEGARGGLLDRAPGWTAALTEAGLTFLGAVATRTLSPYADDEAQRRITYFEILFEWVEGSDGPDGRILVDPWLPVHPMHQR